MSTVQVDRCRLWPPVLTCFALLIIAVPLFLRMPLTNDAEMYDLQAELVRQGGILYRDVLEPNLPGVVWVHLAVRSVLGTSAEALKIFDLMVFAGIAALASRLVHLAGGSRGAAVWTVVALFGFYGSQSEWIHCQRDIWLLLPALGAVTWRIESVHTGRSLAHRDRFLVHLLEGSLWGCGVWLKPYVIFPAAAVWVVSQLLQHTGISRGASETGQAHQVHEPDDICKSLKMPLIELAGLLLGAGFVGALGVMWMIRSGCWPHFVDTALHWNPDYFAAGKSHWTLERFVPMVLRFFPWFGLHLVAIMLIVKGLAHLLRGDAAPDDPRRAVLALTASTYVGWMIQAFGFQHLFDYVHAPTILLAILLVSLGSLAYPHMAVRVLSLAFALLAIWWSPLLQPKRLGLWPICVRGPITPAVRGRLSHFRNPNRRDLEQIEAYLRQQNVSGKDVCFYNSDFVGMYRKMGLMPPTRYVYFYETVRFLPSHQQTILQDLQAAPHRYVVTDVLTAGIRPERMDRLGPNGRLADAQAQPRHWTTGYPWSYPAVFRAGTYLVHRLDGPVTALSLPRQIASTSLSLNPSPGDSSSLQHADLTTTR